MWTDFYEVQAKDRRYFQMHKALFEPLFEIEAIEEQLKNEQPGKGGQFLIFETHRGNFVEFCLNLCFTGFHLRWPPGYGRLFSR